MWAGKNIVPETKYASDGTTLRPILENMETLEALYENKYWKDGKELKREDNRGKCRAIYKFVTLMALVSYHNDPFIQEIMRAQVIRVGEAFEHLEANVLPNLDPTFKRRGLKDEWVTYMKALHKDRLGKLNDVLKDKVKIFRGESTMSQVRRWDFAGTFWTRAKDKDSLNCGFEKDDKRMEERVKLLIEAYDKLDPVETELKLD